MIGMLRRVARSAWWPVTGDHGSRSAAAPPAEVVEGPPARDAEPVARRPSPRPASAASVPEWSEREASAGQRPPSRRELEAVAVHAKQRAALYHRKVLLGRGEPRRLAELERVAAGAADRLRRFADGTGAGR